MAQKKSAPTDEELSAMFEGIDDDDNPSQNQTATTTTASSKKPTPTSTEADDDDPLAELANLAAAPRISTSSRPSTPARSLRTRSPPPRRSDVHTPTTPSGRSSEEKAPAFMEQDQRMLRAPPAPTPSQASLQQSGGGGGWWGGISGIASAAFKQAEAAVKEIQKNEDAQKWAEQVKGNVGALKGFGLNDLRSRAIPTFTNILHTLAPPISQHERLQIHITHDLVGYPSLDPLVYETFSRVMSQVEGGDLLVIQRGSESSQRRPSEVAYDGGSSGGWGDGPWWRQNDSARSIGAVKGLVEGSKLTRVSAEDYGTEFFAARGGIEEAAKQATAVLNESNPVRSSDIFIAIQAIGYTSSAEYFSTGVSAREKNEVESVVVDESQQPDELVCFAVYLHDPIHSIAFSTLSQSFPQKWSDWVDAKSSESANDGSNYDVQLPDSIVDILENGGVDPREWVAEWMEEILSSAVGVVAQRYVARRMGVGEGGIGRGKRREMVVESGGGEAARAI